MRRTLMIGSLVAAIAVPAVASAGSYCEQQAHDRKVTGTVLGGIGGALIGQAISHHTTGTLLGAASGALVGNQVARVNCPDNRAYYAPSRYDGYDHYYRHDNGRRRHGHHDDDGYRGWRDDD